MPVCPLYPRLCNNPNNYQTSYGLNRHILAFEKKELASGGGPHVGMKYPCKHQSIVKKEQVDKVVSDDYFNDIESAVVMNGDLKTMERDVLEIKALLVAVARKIGITVLTE